jgi:hypothetical protein
MSAIYFPQPSLLFGIYFELKTLELRVTQAQKAVKRSNPMLWINKIPSRFTDWVFLLAGEQLN